MDGTTLSTKRRRKRAQSPKLSRHAKPAELSLEAWQIELRRQFGREQKYRIKNLGEEPVFSEYEVANPQSRTTYRVAVRGVQPGDNYCTCPDFATNTLGTCKHIECTLAFLERKRGGKAALAAGCLPPHSEVFLHYGAERQVRFRPGSDCPRELARLASRFFDEEGTLRASAFQSFEAFLKESARFEHDLRCYDDVLALVAEVRDRDERAARVAEAFPAGPRSKGFKGLVASRGSVGSSAFTAVAFIRGCRRK